MIIPFNYSGGTWNYDSDKGIGINWCLFSGSQYTSSSLNTWLTGNYIGSSNQVNLCDSTDNEFYLAQVQFEVGYIATPFEFRHTAIETALCQRYYGNYIATGQGYGYRYGLAGVVYGIDGNTFHTRMRDNPDGVIITAPTYNNCTDYDLVGNTLGFIHRVTVTANGSFRAYAGLYTFDAEIL
jgi:hypothetical protein